MSATRRAKGNDDADGRLHRRLSARAPSRRRFSAARRAAQGPAHGTLSLKLLPILVTARPVTAAVVVVDRTARRWPHKPGGELAPDEFWQRLSPTTLATLCAVSMSTKTMANTISVRRRLSAVRQVVGDSTRRLAAGEAVPSRRRPTDRRAARAQYRIAARSRDIGGCFAVRAARLKIGSRRSRRAAHVTARALVIFIGSRPGAAEVLRGDARALRNAAPCCLRHSEHDSSSREQGP